MILLIIDDYDDDDYDDEDEDEWQALMTFDGHASCIPFIAWNSNDLTATSLFSDGEWFRLVDYCTILYYVNMCSSSG